MQVTVSKWGNSLGIRLPKALAAELHLEDGSSVDLEPGQGGYLLIPSSRARTVTYRLVDLVRAMTKRDREPRELAWGPARGDEAW